MSAVLDAREARLEPMTVQHLDAVVGVEQQAYSHPWTRGNFIDSLHAGYHCQVLAGGGAMVPVPPPPAWRRAPLLPAGDAAAPSWPGLHPAAGPAGAGADGPGALLGYFVAMQGVEEVHLLNITVAPAFQRQGWAPLMLEALGGWARTRHAQWLWLEVRIGNQRAQDVYLRHGFRRVGVRKGYYPAAGGRREDALVMSLRLNESASAWGGLRQ